MSSSNLPVLVAFLAVVVGAYYVGALMGFGTTVTLVTFASLLIPVRVLMPVVIALNILFGSYFAWRHRHTTQWRTLFVHILPLVGLGVPFGMALFRLRDAVWLRLAFGVFIMLLASLQLRLTATPGEQPPTQPLGRWRSAAILGIGGLIHGLYATGGPLIIYVLGRRIRDKRAFRSTAATLFLILTWVLQIDYVASGLVTAEVLKMVALSLPAMVLGIVLGERTFGRLRASQFRRGLWLLLLVGGITVTAKCLFEIGLG